MQEEPAVENQSVGKLSSRLSLTALVILGVLGFSMGCVALFVSSPVGVIFLLFSTDQPGGLGTLIGGISLSLLYRLRFALIALGPVSFATSLLLYRARKYQYSLSLSLLALTLLGVLIAAIQKRF